MAGITRQVLEKRENSFGKGNLFVALVDSLQQIKGEQETVLKNSGKFMFYNRSFNYKHSDAEISNIKKCYPIIEKLINQLKNLGPDDDVQECIFEWIPESGVHNSKEIDTLLQSLVSLSLRKAGVQYNNKDNVQLASFAGEGAILIDSAGYDWLNVKTESLPGLNARP